jgi:hypothetical protein
MTRPRDVGTLDMRDPANIRDRAPDPMLLEVCGVPLNPHERSLLAAAHEGGGILLHGEAVDLCGDWRDPATADRAHVLLRRLYERGLLGRATDASFRLTNPTGQRVGAACAQQPEGE